MSEHPWASDPQAQSALRAAEDAAAVPAIQHRDLPEQVAALAERVARLEAAVMPKSVSASDAEGLENKGGTMPADGLRTERVTLEVTQRTESYAPLSEFDWTAMLRSACRGRLFDGESVRVVEEPAEIAPLSRSTPPRVKAPPVNAAWVDFLHERDAAWIAAIRAAGGEVD